MDADQGLRLLGKYSRWQIERYVAYSLGFGVPFAWMVLSVIFIGDTPNYRCAIPENATLNETIPLVEQNGQLVYDKCSMYANLTVDNRTVPCQYGYWYDPASGYESTLTTQWDLVCGKEWLVELSMIIGNVGACLGALIFNRLCDVYGRKRIFLICLWSNVPVALVQAFSPHIAVYITLAFIDGLQQQGTVGSSFVMSMELFPTEQRTFAGNAVEFFWLFGYMSLVLIAYFIRNWRYLMLAITLPLILTFPFYWLLSESIPWLLVNGRREEAEKILKEAAKRNKITLPENVFCKPPEGIELLNKVELPRNDIETKANEGDMSSDKERNAVPDASHTSTTLSTISTSPKATYGVADVFRSRVLRKYTLVQFAVWFVVALTYSAMNMTVTYLPGDRYLNSFLYSAIELPAYIAAWVLADKIGRRLPLVGFNVIGGVALILTVFQTVKFSGNIKPLIVTLSLIGKMMTTAAFAVVYVMAPEVFPTNVRNIGLGMCQFFARISGFISPLARTLTRSHPWMPPVIIGVLSIVVGFLTLLLPETRHTKLPDSIEEVDQWQKRKTPKEER